MTATIDQEINLLIFLDTMINDCLIFLGIDERYIIITNNNKSFGFGRVLHCKYIYNAIKSKNTNRMTPKEVMKIFDELGWLDE